MMISRNNNFVTSKFRRSWGDSSPLHHSWGHSDANQSCYDTDINLDHDSYHSLPDHPIDDNRNKESFFTFYSKGRQQRQRSRYSSNNYPFSSIFTFNSKTLFKRLPAITISIIIALILLRSILTIPLLSIQQLPNPSSLRIPTAQLINTKSDALKADAPDFLDKKAKPDVNAQTDETTVSAAKADSISHNDEVIDDKASVIVAKEEPSDESRNRARIQSESPSSGDTLLMSSNSTIESSNQEQHSYDASDEDKKENPIAVVDSNDDDDNQELEENQPADTENKNERMTDDNDLSKGFEHDKIVQMMNELHAVKPIGKKPEMSSAIPRDNSLLDSSSAK